MTLSELDRSGLRSLALRQLGDDQLVRDVDQPGDLVVRDAAVEQEVVPTVLPDIGALPRRSGIALKPDVGSLPVTALQPDAGRGIRNGTVHRAEEGEDLVANLGHHVAFPGFVLPRTGLGEAVIQPSVLLRHLASLSPTNLS